QLVRRLPAVTGLPDADRPLPAGTLRPGGFCEREDRTRRGRGRVQQDGARRRAAVGGGAMNGAGALRVDRAVTSGTFSLDGGTWEVDNNVWVVGDDRECVVIDAPHDVDAILAAVAGRSVTAILLTHAHDDHIDAAVALADATGAETYLHPEDRMLWDRVHAQPPGQELADGDTIEVAGTMLHVLH